MGSLTLVGVDMVDQEEARRRGVGELDGAVLVGEGVVEIEPSLMSISNPRR
jgi:hypothetical protein